MSIASQTTNSDVAESVSPIMVEKVYTPEELLALPDGKSYELVGGKLVERNRGGEASWTSYELNRHLGNYISDHRLGFGWGPDGSYQIFGDDGSKVRRPDGSFIAKGKLPNDLAIYIDGKIDEYLQAGVRLIWIVSPESKHVHVYRSGTTVQRLGVEDELSGEDVLPGFTLTISNIFPVPSGESGE